MAGREPWRDFFRSVFETSTRPMALVGEDLLVADANEPWCRMQRATRDEVVGRAVTELLPPDRAAEAPRRWQEIYAAGDASGEGIMVDPSGAERRVHYAARAGSIGGRRLVLIVVDAPQRHSLSAVNGRQAALSDRERQIVGLIALGDSSREAADRLHLSRETVRTHVRNAMGKVSARTRAHLVAIALVEGIVEPPGEPT